MEWEQGTLLYEGKSKRVYRTSHERDVLIEFKDDATAFNAQKHAVIANKGRVNCAISTHLFDRLSRAGVPHHFVSSFSDTAVVCRKLEIVPLEVVVRNVVAGSMAKRYAIDEGEELSRPVVEWFYKSDALGDPLVGEDVPAVLGWARAWEMAFMKEQALVVNSVLAHFFDELDITLVDFKLEFGRTRDGALLLADEITPDGCRLWERGSQRKLDKDVFRRDLGDLSATYLELYERVFGRALENA